MRLVSSQNKNAKLVIVGRDDGCLEEVQDKVKEYNLEEKIIFAGPLYEKNRFPAYADADLFIHVPIHYEETATASLEACACSTPVIVTKQASIPWLDDYHAGFCVDCDVEKIVEKVMYLLEDSDRLKTYSLNARRLIEDKFSMDKVVTQMEQEFLNVIVEKQENF
jgi:glycosyltransferase involved in cell wall biosynthesis